MLDYPTPKKPISRRQLLKAAALGACSSAVPIAPMVWAKGSEELRIMSRGDVNSNYSLGLLKLALEKAGSSVKFNISEGDFAPMRQRKELVEGGLDILWTATSTEIEEEALPIRVPLYKGLLGHRILIVHKDNKTLFNSVQDWNQMLAYRFGQGRDWSDTTIMRANGMKVVTAVKYDNLFLMADGKRFDGFPRGVHEPWAEIDKRPGLELTVDEHVMLVYRSPFYLFVAPSKKTLAEDIYNGMLMAVDDGSFDEYFYNNPTVKMVLEKANLKNRIIFNLKNPNLPPKTPVDDARLWVDINKL
ncbi:MAG: diguanylate cyclase [Marinagarivorans sp.]